MGSTSVGFWIFITAISYTLGIIQIYAALRFKSMQSLLIIRKRFSKLVLIEACFVVIYLLLAVPLWVNSLFNATQFGINNSFYSVIDGISDRISIPFIHFILIIEAARLWLVSYSLHFLHSSTNSSWKSQIDSSFAEKDWYLKNKNKYGNAKYIIKRMFIYYLFLVIILIISYLMGFGGFLEALIYLFQIIFIFYIYFKCRKYKQLNDKLLLHYEFRATIIIWSISVFLFFVCQCLFVAGFVIYGVLLVIFTALLGNVTPSLLSTLWIPRQIGCNEIWSEEYNELSESKTIIMMKETIHNDNDNNQQKNKTISAKLLEILNNSQHFESFIQWMYREFSQEIPLCFIELIQFKQYLIDNMDDNDNDNNEYVFVNILYDSVPKSSIVFIGDDVKLKARSLYNKYIKYNAEFEVNLSFELRNKYVAFDESNWDLDVKQLVNEFDDILHEMFQFMLNSYRRYEKT